MTQLTLDDSDTRRIKVYRCTRKVPQNYGGGYVHAQPCWHAKCLDCGAVLTAYDHTKEEARVMAQNESCRCST